MKNSLYVGFSLLSLVVLLMPGCGLTEKKAEQAAGEAKSEAVAAQKLIIVDVNPEDVYKDAHIDGAVNVAMDKVEDASKEWNKATPIVVYCADYTCQASHAAAAKLKGLGFTDVTVYTGGISEWNKLSKENPSRHPVTGAAQQEFLKKPVEKVATKEGEIGADELAKRIEESKK
jgi:rhodanese-related sulfurtransferase